MRVSYQGKTVNVGIDVHKQSYVLSAYCEGSVVKKSCRMEASPKACALFLLDTFSGARIRTAYEAGFSGYGLHRVLEENGIESHVNELGDMSRFPNERTLFSYLGLAPSEYSSGDRIRRGNITRQGPAYLRGLLVEAAWRAIAKDTELRNKYEQIKQRAGGKKAIVAIARILVGRIRSCLKNGQAYRKVKDSIG